MIFKKEEMSGFFSEMPMLSLGSHLSEETVIHLNICHLHLGFHLHFFIIFHVTVIVRFFYKICFMNCYMDNTLPDLSGKDFDHLLPFIDLLSLNIL